MNGIATLRKREYAARTLIGLAALSFVLAVLGNLGFSVGLDVDPEGYSRACTNLALLGIGLSVCFNPPKPQ